MTKNNIIRSLLGGLAVLTLGSSLASASTITWYNNIFVPNGGNPATNVPQGAPTPFTTPFTTTVDIPKFDQTSGNPNTMFQLTSVQIAVNWAVTGSLGVFNTTAGTIAFTNGAVNFPVEIVGPDGTDVDTTAQGSGVSGNATPGFSSHPGLTGSGSSSDTVIGAGLGQYQGFGSANLAFDVTSGTGTFGGSGGGPNQLFFGGDASVAASLTVTYNYEEVTVPEPGTLGLMGGAFLCVGYFVRRRKNA
jgi:hypothetical protein